MIDINLLNKNSQSKLLNWTKIFNFLVLHKPFKNKNNCKSKLHTSTISLLSFKFHGPHFPLYCLELIWICWTTVESLPRCTVFAFVVIVLITVIDAAVATASQIWLVRNIQIRTPSKFRAITLTIEDCILGLYQSELVVVSQRKNEWLFRIVNNIFILNAPLQRREASNLIVVEPSLNHSKSVRNFVTFLVKLLSTKLIFTGSVQ